MREPAVSQNLATGRVVRDSFGLAGLGIPSLFQLALIGEVLRRAVDRLATGADPFLFQPAPAQSAQETLVQALLAWPAQMTHFLTMAILIWSAYGLLTHARLSPKALGAAFARAFVPLVLLSALTSATGEGATVLLAAARTHPTYANMASAFLGAVTLLAAYVYLQLTLWLGSAVAMIEGCDIARTVRRSAALARGHRGAFFLISVAILACFTVPLFVLWLASGIGIPPKVPLPLLSLTGVASLFLSIALTVLLAAATAVVYRALTADGPDAAARPVHPL